MHEASHRPYWPLGAAALAGAVAGSAQAGSVGFEPIGDGDPLVSAQVDVEGPNDDWVISVANLGLGTTEVEGIFFERRLRSSRTLNTLHTATFETTGDADFDFGGDDFGRNVLFDGADDVDWQDTGFSFAAVGEGLGPSETFTLTLRKNNRVQPSEDELTDLLSEVGYRLAVTVRSPGGSADVITLVTSGTLDGDGNGGGDGGGGGGGGGDGGGGDPPPTVIPNPAAGAAGLALLAAAASGRKRRHRG